MYGTHFFETKCLNNLRNVAVSAPSALYVGLYMTSPTNTGMAGTEIDYPNYIRQAVTWTTPYEIVNPSGGNSWGIKNTQELVFPISSIDAGEVRYIGVSDSQSRGSGNMYLYGELTLPLTVHAQTQPTIFNEDLLYFMTGNFSVYYKQSLLNVLRGTSLAGKQPHWALYNDNPDTGGIELSGGAYARVPITFSAPEVQSNGETMIQNSSLLKFPAPTTSWGYWAFDSVMDAASGGENLIIMSNELPETIQKNYVPAVNVGDFKVIIN